MRNPGVFSFLWQRKCYIAYTVMRNPGVFSFLWQRKCYIAHTVMRMSQNHPLCSRLCFLFKKKPLLLDDFSSILQQLSPYHTSAIWRMQGLPFYVYHLRFREIDDTSAPTSWNFIITSGHFPAGKPLFEEIDDTSSSTFWKFIITSSGFAAGKPLFEEINDTSAPTFWNFIITSSHFVSGKTLFEKKMIRHIPFLGSLSSLQTRCSLYPICSASPGCSREAFATG